MDLIFIGLDCLSFVTPAAAGLGTWSRILPGLCANCQRCGLGPRRGV